MPISIELKPEVEERLGREASAKGLSVEADVEDLIERQALDRVKGLLPASTWKRLTAS